MAGSEQSASLTSSDGPSLNVNEEMRYAERVAKWRNTPTRWKLDGFTATFTNVDDDKDMTGILREKRKNAVHQYMRTTVMRSPDWPEDVDIIGKFVFRSVVLSCSKGPIAESVLEQMTGCMDKFGFMRKDTVEDGLMLYSFQHDYILQKIGDMALMNHNKFVIDHTSDDTSSSVDCNESHKLKMLMRFVVMRHAEWPRCVDAIEEMPSSGIKLLCGNMKGDVNTTEAVIACMAKYRFEVDDGRYGHMRFYDRNRMEME